MVPYCHFFWSLALDCSPSSPGPADNVMKFQVHSGPPEPTLRIASLTSPLRSPIPAKVATFAAATLPGYVDLEVKLFAMMREEIQ